MYESQCGLCIKRIKSREKKINTDSIPDTGQYGDIPYASGNNSDVNF